MGMSVSLDSRNGDEEDTVLNNAPHHFEISCNNNKDHYSLVGRPCELSAFSFVPTQRDHETKDRKIHNYKRDDLDEEKAKKGYDRLYNIEYDYNNKVHRDDRKNARLHGLYFWDEEITKATTTLSSGVYGKRQLKLPNNSRETKPATVNYVSKLDP